MPRGICNYRGWIYGFVVWRLLRLSSEKQIWKKLFLTQSHELALPTLFENWEFVQAKMCLNSLHPWSRTCAHSQLTGSSNIKLAGDLRIVSSTLSYQPHYWENLQSIEHQETSTVAQSSLVSTQRLFILPLGYPGEEGPVWGLQWGNSYSPNWAWSQCRILYLSSCIYLRIWIIYRHGWTYHVQSRVSISNRTCYFQSISLRVSCSTNSRRFSDAYLAAIWLAVQ